MPGATAMTGDPCNLTLDVSEHLFNLTTESLRLRSNETRRYQTLECLLNDRIGMPCALEDHTPETLRDHLTAIPTGGDIRIDLTVTRSSMETLDAGRHLMSEGLGIEITLGDALSIILFHYVAGQKAARILKQIGFGGFECGSRPAGSAAAAE